MVLASLRRRFGRALALLVGLLVATTGFTMLTGSTETSRLQVTGTVAENFRGYERSSAPRQWKSGSAEYRMVIFARSSA
jgi:hypothetical protein